VSLNRLLTVTVTGWAILVLGSVGARVALLSSPMSVTESIAWLFVAFAPAAVVLSIFRGPSSPTVAQVLYDVEHTKDGDSGRSARGGRAS